MMYYIFAKIQSFYNNNIIIEANNIGYECTYIGSDLLSINQNQKFYIYKYKTLYSEMIFAFSNEKIFENAKILFEINNIGPKIVNEIFNNFTFNEFEEIIKSRNFEKLSKLKNISENIAKNIINTISTKILKIPPSSKIATLIDSLKKLGYKSNQINIILDNLDYQKKYDSLFKEAIEKLSI